MISCEDVNCRHVSGVIKRSLNSGLRFLLARSIFNMTGLATGENAESFKVILIGVSTHYRPIMYIYYEYSTIGGWPEPQ